MNLHKFEEESVDVLAAQGKSTGILSFPIFLDDVLLLETTNQLSIEKCFSLTPLNGLVYDFCFGTIASSGINLFLM